MIKNYTPAQYRIKTSYELVFDDGCNNGFGFPCDKEGNLLATNPDTKANYIWCMENQDKFKRFNEIIEYKHRIRDEAHGICHCGEKVYLINEYYGACQCGKCGQWYNLFGQKILPPMEWGEDLCEY